MTGASVAGQLVIVSGPSGVGKSTVCQALVDRLDAMLSVSMTTRPRRPHEVDGEAYQFVRPETFERMIGEGGLLEYARVYGGRYYGTPARPVLDALEAGRNVILEIEIDGTIQVVRRFPDAVSVYLLAPEGEQRERLIGRGQDDPEAIRERLSKAEAEIARARACGAYRFFVVNQSVDETVEEIVRIVQEATAA